MGIDDMLVTRKYRKKRIKFAAYPNDHLVTVELPKNTHKKVKTYK